MTTSRTAIFFVALGAILWATDTIFRQPLTESLPASVIVFYEHIFLAIISIPILWKAFRFIKKLNAKEWISLIFIGVGASAFATWAFTQSFAYGNPTVTILLQKVQPIVAILLAHLFLKERIKNKAQFWSFAVLALIGAYVLSFKNLSPFQGMGDAQSMSIIYALIAAVLWGSATVFGRFVLKKISPTQASSLRFLIALPALFILVIAQGYTAELGAVTGMDIGSLIFMALITGFLAMVLYYRGLKRSKASIATIAELTFPVAASIINWIVLDFALSLTQILGAVVLLLAIFQMNRLNYREQQKI